MLYSYKIVYVIYSFILNWTFHKKQQSKCAKFLHSYLCSICARERERETSICDWTFELQLVFPSQAIPIRLMIVAHAKATKLLSLITTCAKYIATSDVIFLPSRANTRRRFPAKARSTTTVIHVTSVVLTARTIRNATTATTTSVKTVA